MPSPATLAVTYTLSNGQTSDATLWNTNYADIVNFTNSSLFLGTVAVDNAAAGYRGEYQESIVAAQNFAATGVIGDLTSLSLTAGDWDVTANLLTSAAGATVTAVLLGISTTSGNSGTGLVDGSSTVNAYPPTAANPGGGCIANLRVSISTTTTYYFKLRGTFSVATPTASGRLSARRIR